MRKRQAEKIVKQIEMDHSRQILHKTQLRWNTVTWNKAYDRTDRVLNKYYA